MTTTTDMTKTVTMTTTQETRDTAPLTGIEFFSGVGGYSLAINQKLLRIEIMKAFDINTNANKVFSLNHVKEPKVTGIDRLNEIETRADVWLMSPPCQPFTSGGSRKDDKDPRSEGLLNLIKLLPVTLPKVVFLENVYNFEISNSRKLLVSSLISSGYRVKEMMLSPIQFGIPNDRKRYYLTAYLPSTPTLEPIEYPLDGSNIIKEVSDYIPGYKTPTMRPLSEYIDDDSNDMPDLLVNSAHIRKRTNFRFDVVTRDSTVTSTFTKAYGSHHFFGSGSLLTKDPYTPTMTCEDLINLRPRYFSPLEVSKFMGMEGIKWPEGMSTRQKFKLLGNGVSVDVVGILLERLVLESGY